MPPIPASTCTWAVASASSASGGAPPPAAHAAGPAPPAKAATTADAAAARSAPLDAAGAPARQTTISSPGLAVLSAGPPSCAAAGPGRAAASRRNTSQAASSGRRRARRIARRGAVAFGLMGAPAGAERACGTPVCERAAAQAQRGVLAMGPDDQGAPRTPGQQRLALFPVEQAGHFQVAHAVVLPARGALVRRPKPRKAHGIFGHPDAVASNPPAEGCVGRDAVVQTFQAARRQLSGRCTAPSHG
ncbi:MAG: hypothetical protein J3K34DRAFT_287124 [Monoraphidium minutum]|nr:MAG: hypothetical protein J3K34DRAFT_287124 [Monoraphidium minutum]